MSGSIVDIPCFIGGMHSFSVPLIGLILGATDLAICPLVCRGLLYNPPHMPASPMACEQSHPVGGHQGHVRWPWQDIGPVAQPPERYMGRAGCGLEHSPPGHRCTCEGLPLDINNHRLKSVVSSLYL